MSDRFKVGLLALWVAFWVGVYGWTFTEDFTGIIAAKDQAHDQGATD